MSFTRLAAAAALLAASTQPALAQTANPQGSGPIVAALAWLQGTLLGNVATAVNQVELVGLVGHQVVNGCGSVCGVLGHGGSGAAKYKNNTSREVIAGG